MISFFMNFEIQQTLLYSIFSIQSKITKDACIDEKLKYLGKMSYKYELSIKTSITMAPTNYTET